MLIAGLEHERNAAIEIADHAKIERDELGRRADAAEEAARVAAAQAAEHHVTRAELDSVTRDRDSARALLAVAEAAVTTATARLGALETDLAELRSQLHSSPVLPPAEGDPEVEG